MPHTLLSTITPYLATSHSTYPRQTVFNYVAFYPACTEGTVQLFEYSTLTLVWFSAAANYYCSFTDFIFYVMPCFPGHCVIILASLNSSKYSCCLFFTVTLLLVYNLYIFISADTYCALLYSLFLLYSSSCIYCGVSPVSACLSWLF
jgi:hypothetical protein